MDIQLTRCREFFYNVYQMTVTYTLNIAFVNYTQLMLKILKMKSLHNLLYRQPSEDIQMFHAGIIQLIPGSSTTGFPTIYTKAKSNLYKANLYQINIIVNLKL